MLVSWLHSYRPFPLHSLAYGRWSAMSEMNRCGIDDWGVGVGQRHKEPVLSPFRIPESVSG